MSRGSASLYNCLVSFASQEKGKLEAEPPNLRYQALPGNGDPEALPRLSCGGEAEPLDMGSQAEPNQLECRGRCPRARPLAIDSIMQKHLTPHLFDRQKLQFRR